MHFYHLSGSWTVPWTSPKKNAISKNAAAATAQTDPKWNVLTRVCCHTLCHLYICPLHYSSVTHPLEADCTFLMYWKEIIWSLFNKYISKLHKNLGCQGWVPTYLVKNSSVSFKCRWGPCLSSPPHLLICYLNIYSPLLNINADDVSIFN